MRQDRTPKQLLASKSESANRTALALILVACLFVFGCVQPEQPVHEEPPAPQADGAEVQPERAADLPPPKVEEVDEAVHRVFKDAALIDTGRGESFIAGDFNGDYSQDIAVVVKPVPGKLAEMNGEFPTWLLRDALQADQLETSQLRVEPNEALLAVIHGHGPDGWRDPEATQTYLLKNGVGSSMKAYPRKEFVTANRGKKLPRIRGDLIGDVLQNKRGYLYYTGPTYSWYDPERFKGEPERRLVHGRATAAVDE